MDEGGSIASDMPIAMGQISQLVETKNALKPLKQRFLLWGVRDLQSFSLSSIVATSFGLLLALSLVSVSTLAMDQRHSADFTPTAYIYLPFVVRQTTPSPPQWLSYVNYYRELAGLPSVVENSSWSYGNWLHARYMVKNDVVQHTEDSDNPWYTPEGLAAAQSSNLVGHYDASASDEFAVDAWMQAPFHALGILDPQLLQVGYGSYREADGGLQMGAGLDVLRGLGTVPPSVRFPIKWPSEGKIVPLTSHWGEYPSPLTSCPGYSAPTGLPIILQIGPGHLVPNVTSHSFMQGNSPLEHCVFDETSYSNPDRQQQDLGRSILNSRDAIVLIPRFPLLPGTSYTVSITVNGQTHTWSFTVSRTAETNLIASEWEIPRLNHALTFRDGESESREIQSKIR